MEPLLEVKGLDCGLLTDVSLHVDAGEIVCLTGASGSGKTRLLRAIADLDPNRGHLRIAGEARESMPAHAWRRRAGYLPSESQWWRDSVGEHFARREDESLAALGFDPDVMHWEVARLSSGERARLALIRLWSYRPQALLLDEPTANLDPESAHAMERWLTDVARQGRSLLWVSHDRDQVERVADRAFDIRKGRLWTSSR
ncbi:MAG: ABC transporter ATP-binding protein [Pseudomonadota bacterium]|nr:ABC transporter ATP-binding protein [Pseudomonadota bacterium]